MMFFFVLMHTGAHPVNYCALSLPIADSVLHTKVDLSGLVLLGIFFIMWFFARAFIRRSAAHGLLPLTHVLYWAWFAVDLYHAPTFLP